MKSAFFFFFILVCSISGITQTPQNDQAWELFSPVSDEFDGTAVDVSKWSHQPPWSDCHGDACLTTSSNNRLVENGLLKLIVRQENCQCDGSKTKQYSAGAIFSKTPVKYGFFEIRCRIPELSESPETGKGFGPNFWLWPDHPNSYNDNPVNWSELDIFEFDAEFNNHTSNIHYEEETSPFWSLRNPNNNNVDPFDFRVDFSDFHKFGCEWTSDYINFYFDDHLFQSVSNKFIEKLLPMNIRADINIPATGFSQYFVQNSLFPYTYEIDYIKVYKLKEDCEQEIVQSNVNFSTFDYSVKKSITISESTVPLNTSVTLRAKEYIQIKGEFIVPNGSELILAPAPCCN